MTHTLTLEESSKEVVFSKLMRRPSEPFGPQTSARLLNKQMKFLFSALHKNLWSEALEGIHKIFDTSNKSRFWGLPFCGLIIFAMMAEAMQMTIRCKEATDKSEKLISESDENATIEIEQMEEKWTTLQGLFHKAYIKCDPIHDDKIIRSLDAPSQQLAKSVRNIINKHRRCPQDIRLAP